jgi:hypothetical protein
MNEWLKQKEMQQAQQKKKDLLLWVFGSIALVIVMVGLWIVMK